jgi:transposase-like protein
MPPVNRNEPKRAASSESQYSLMEFMKEFPDDATCLDWLWRNRYSEDGEHAFCPKCETDRAFKRYETKQQRQSWTCTGCGEHLHPTAGTIFHKSSTSLHLWFYAMYLMTSTRCGISAKQMERELGVTYKTAWRICHLIRHELMEQDELTLSGAVEMDETYVGGRPRYKKGERPKDDLGRSRFGPRPASHPTQKTAVLGAVERGGRVRAIVTPASLSNVHSLVSRVLPSSTVFTDESRLYDRLKRRGYEHKRINHSEKVYVSGDIHTQTIEGFWSLTKNGIRGVYHAVSAKHLQGYLNEYAWRYNRRKQERAMFEELLLRTVGS